MLRPIASGIALALALTAIAPAAARADDTADELKMGAQLYSELKSRGEIVEASPLYDTLRPIAESITRVVQPRLPYPVRFYIVHEQQPNAFAAPGGNIYVVDALFRFVHNKEELEGTLCHESSHLLYHDPLTEARRDQAIENREILALLLLGGGLRTIIAADIIGQIDSNHYSRDVEERADLTGSDTCAAAGSNPWGLVWLFRDFENADLQQPPEFLSDHPDDEHRIAALMQHFQDNPKTFARFDDNPKHATPLHIPKTVPETLQHRRMTCYQVWLFSLPRLAFARSVTQEGR